MKNKIFVSYKFSDKQVCHSIKTMSVDHNGPVKGSFVFVENDMSGHGSTAVNNEIKKVMSNCNIALFLVGNDNHNSNWIKREVDIAISKGMKLVVMRQTNSYGGIPNALLNQSYTECPWGANHLAKLVN